MPHLSKSKLRWVEAKAICTLVFLSRILMTHAALLTIFSCMEHATPPEFGPNGVVLNSPTMTDSIRQDIEDGKADRRSMFAQIAVIAMLILMGACLYLLGDNLPTLPGWTLWAALAFQVAFWTRKLWKIGRIEQIAWRIGFPVSVLVLYLLFMAFLTGAPYWARLTGYASILLIWPMLACLRALHTKA